MTPSAYQQRIFDFVANDSRSALIEAVAGSGKTTTIVEAIKLLPVGSKVLFLAFNKSIAVELQARLPAWATAATFHSIGLKCITNGRKVRVDDRKVDNLARNYQPKNLPLVVKLVDFAKQWGIGVCLDDTKESWDSIVAHFGLDTESDLDESISVASNVLADSNRDKATVDFNDMIYLPLKFNLANPQYDYIFVDEAQDTNNVRRLLVSKLIKPTGRVIAVGDSRQAIYGFTGADADSMNLIREQFKAEKLPLSICYRCSKAVVEAAKMIVPQIEANPTAIDGSVNTIKVDVAKPTSKDVVLCRNTAPLISLAFRYIAQGIGCRVRGRDIGKGLVSLINQQKASNVADLLEKVTAYKDLQIARLTAQGKHSQAQSIDDKCECIMTIANGLKDGATIADMIAYIDRLFDDSLNGGILTLSTIHKAKGLEWPNVYIIRPDLMHSKWAKKAWQMEQERNIQYVAITRAKENLYYVVE